ncbi:MAG: oligopeptide transporter, OPT family [Planctomycetes bacterium]|nr:oligopeptide transporter, OPT family [Planctomycetota bacterium]MBL7038996.1 oligopeptide transporter, OPT family [Pirellulaceae bacterium]
MEDQTDSTKSPPSKQSPPLTCTPYVSAAESPLEFSLKAVVAGVLFGICFGAANAYLGLQAGLTISTSIPVAVMTVAAFRLLRQVGMPGTILEANISQTVGSASSSVASGVIFTLPALFMWQMAPGLLQMTLLAMTGGLLGVLFMIPLRRYLIEKEHGKLPYPEGTACSEVLVASEVGGSRARNVFLGLGAGLLFKFFFGWLKVLPAQVKVAVPGLLKAQVGMKMSAALFGVGYILGPRVASIMVAGGLLSSLVIIPGIAYWGADRGQPFFPETELTIAEMSAGEIWNRYVRYIGAGAVAAAGLITLIRSIPVMAASFRLGAAQLTERFGAEPSDVPRTQRDLPLRVVGCGVVVLAVAMAVVPQVFGELPASGARICAAVLVVICSFFFVTVAARIVGLVGVTSNPTSGMTIASLLGTSTVFLMMGWTDSAGKAAALTVGCVVAIAASIAGDTSQDLKTGFLLGATPRRQQIGELLGVLTSAVFVCLTVLLLDRAYGFGSPELPAPQATLMKLVIEGVLEAKLPWILVGIGAGIALATELCRLPSLPLAVGVYLPVSTMATVFAGGLLRWVMERRAGSEEDRLRRREQGVLFGSGLVGGEGVLGVMVAGVVFWQSLRTAPGEKVPLPLEIGQRWIESAAEAVGLTGAALAAIPQVGAALVFVVLATIFARCCRSR